MLTSRVGRGAAALVLVGTLLGLGVPLRHERYDPNAMTELVLPPWDSHARTTRGVPFSWWYAFDDPSMATEAGAPEGLQLHFLIADLVLGCAVALGVGKVIDAYVGRRHVVQGHPLRTDDAPGPRATG